MTTAVAWRDVGSGRVAIAQPVPIAARLFGLPFLAAGLYFLYQFAGGLLHPGELTIAGWILLPVMAAAFLIPGWMLTTFRKRTTIDAGARQAAEEYDFLVYTRRKTTPIAADAHVVLRYERGSERTTRGPLMTHSRTGFLLPVYVATGTQEVLVALFSDGEKPAALGFAARIAALLNIDVQDRCVEGGEITPGGVVVERVEDDD